MTCLGRGSTTCVSGQGQAPHKETGAERVEGPRPRPHLESLFQDLLPWHSPEVQPGAEAHHQPPPPLFPHLPEEGSFPDQRRHLALGHTPPMKGTPGSTQAQFGSSDLVHQQRFSVQGPPKCPTATPPGACSQDHIHKAHPGHLIQVLLIHEQACRLTQGPARWLCVHKGRCMYPPLWGFPEPRDREEKGREPQPPRPSAHLCTRVHTVLATSSTG